MRRQQYGEDGDSDAEGIERTPIERKRAGCAEDEHERDRIAQPVAGDQRAQRRRKLRLLRRDEQHADAHEEQDRRCHILDAAYRRCDEPLHCNLRPGYQYPEDRSDEKCDGGLHMQRVVEQQRHQRREQRDGRNALRISGGFTADRPGCVLSLPAKRDGRIGE